MMRCSPEAFAKCPTRALCGRIEDATFTEGSECDLFNQAVMSAPLTVIERIRILNDEEMVEFIHRLVQLGDISGLYCANKKECLGLTAADKGIPVAWCKRCLLEWLHENASEVFV